MLKRTELRSVGKKVVAAELFAYLFYGALFYARYVRTRDAELFCHLALGLRTAVFEAVAHTYNFKLPLRENFAEQFYKLFALNLPLHARKNVFFPLGQKVNKGELVAIFIYTDGLCERHGIFMFFARAYEHEDFVLYAAGGVCGKLSTLALAIGIDGFDKAYRAHRKQVVCLGCARVLFGNMGDEAHIVLYEYIFCLFIALVSELKVAFFLFGRQGLGKRAFALHRARE